MPNILWASPTLLEEEEKRQWVSSTPCEMEEERQQVAASTKIKLPSRPRKAEWKAVELS